MRVLAGMTALCTSLSAFGGQDRWQELRSAIVNNDLPGLTRLLDEQELPRQEAVPLMGLAASQSTPEIIRLLAAYGANVNDCLDETRYMPPDFISPAPRSVVCPLHEAAQRNTLEAVTTLLQLGAKIDQASQPGNETALTRAVRSGRLEMANLLLDLGADANGKATGVLAEGQPSPPAPLTLAISSGMTELVTSLVRHGADLLSTDHGAGALILAVRSGEYPLLKTLIDLGADLNHPDRSGNYPILEGASIYAVNPQLLTLLVRLGANPYVEKPESNGTLTTLITRLGEVYAFNRLDAVLNAGYDPNHSDSRGRNLFQAFASGYQPFTLYSDRTEAVISELLNRLNADPRVTAATYAAQDAQGYTGFHHFAGKGLNAKSLEQFKTLGFSCRTLTAPLDPQSPTRRRGGQSILHLFAGFLRSYAAKISSKELALELDALLAFGCEINERSPEHGQSPLAYAALSGNFEVMNLLLSRGADAKFQYYDGRKHTILHMMIDRVGLPEERRFPKEGWSQSADEVLRQLKVAGIDFNARTREGETAFLLGVRRAARGYNSYDWIPALVREGADINLPNSYGVKPLRLARALKVESGVIDELIRNGAVE